MATGTNGIATEGEAKSKLGYSGSVDTNKCCTKARAIAMGADSAKLTSYKDNQLVKYSDLSTSVIDNKLTVIKPIKGTCRIDAEYTVYSTLSIEYDIDSTKYSATMYAGDSSINISGSFSNTIKIYNIVPYQDRMYRYRW